MRSLAKFNSFINLIKNKPLNSFSIAQNYSQYNYSNTRFLTINMTNNLLMQNKTSFCNNLLSRNISLSTICAKSKDRGGKEKKKPKASKIDLREIGEVLDADELTREMNSAIENMKVNFVKNLTIRSTSGTIEQIPVKLDGKEHQLQELVQIARKPKLIVLNAASFPTAIPDILQAIEKSGLNINPQREGTTIYLPIPKVTKEHRENLAKNAKAIFIRHRDEIKEIRNKTIKKLKKKKDISEDTIKRAEIQVDALCNKFVNEAEIILETKQNELLGLHD